MANMQPRYDSEGVAVHASSAVCCILVQTRTLKVLRWQMVIMTAQYGTVRSRLICTLLNYRQGVQGPCTRVSRLCRAETITLTLSEYINQRFWPDFGVNKVVGML